MVLCYFGDACLGVSNVVFVLVLQPFCVVLVVLVWCYARSAIYVPVLAKAFFSLMLESYLRDFGVAGVMFMISRRCLCWCQERRVFVGATARVRGLGGASVLI